MSVKFLKRLSDEELFEMACLLTHCNKEKMNLCEITKTDSLFSLYMRVKTRDCGVICEFSDFKSECWHNNQVGFCDAMYQKFGKEYSDAFFRNYFGIKEEEK